jgi:hypothetical protein
MRRLFSALVLALALLAGGSASATTLESKFPDYQSELNARLAALPATGLTKLQKRQKATLTKALKLLGIDSRTLAKLVANAKKTVAATDAAFPEDAILGPLEDAVVTGLSVDTSVRNGSLAQSIETLAEGGKARTSAQAKSDGAAADLGLVQSATTHGAQFKLIARANTKIALGERIVRRAGGTTGPGVTVTEFDADINDASTHIHVPAAVPPFGDLQVLYETALDRLTVSVQAQTGGKAYAIIMAVPGNGTGTRDISAESPSSYSSPGFTPPLATVVSGTMTITTWDLEGKKLGGTFDVTYTNGTSQVHVTNGKFSTIDLQVN